MRKYLSLFLFIGLCYACTSTEGTDKKLPEAIQQLHDTLRQQYAPDKRVALFDVNYDVAGKEVTLTGVTTSADAKSSLLSELGQAGYQVTDSLHVLPDEDKLEGKTYGVVNLSVCNIRIQDDFSSEMVTQALMGMPVRILDKKSWYRIQTPDDYIGWVHSAGVYPMTKEEYDEWNRAEKVIVTSHYGFVNQNPDLRSQTVSDVVSGDRFRLEGSEGAFYRIRYPDGKQGYLSKSSGMPETAWRKLLRQDADAIIQTAHTLLGVPYLWAGTSAKGIDCSGYVRTVLYLHDIIIPRDASQQAYVGEHIEIALDFSNLQPGDLIFFGRKATPERKERVVHVAISLGGKKFIHSQGDVRINSFDPADEVYDEYNLNRLLFATRILPYIDKEDPALNTTETNPYYN
ncbi:MAG: NlpC/P60 family protein [Bacteroides sp.]|nr:NlpC/P60 family protein [Bacteroides sp.]